MNHIVMGPWFHSQINRQGRGMGPPEWATDTAEDWRRDVLLPFFNQHLKAGAPKADTPNALIYITLVRTNGILTRCGRKKLRAWMPCGVEAAVPDGGRWPFF